MEKTAIVILNWNGSAMLRQYLPGVVLHSRGEAAVYVADNGSTDGSPDMLRRHFPEVGVIELGRNWGFAEGYNRALEHVEAEYFLLLNSDIEVPPHWLTPLVEFMDAHPRASACQPKVLSLVERGSFEYAGACGGFVDRLGYPFCRGRLLGAVERDSGQYDEPVQVQWATGAALLVRAGMFREVGGFDPRFFAHQEEIDLCWRLRLRGHEVWCVPASHVYHLGGGTLPKGSPMKTYLNFRNNLTMLYKCLPDAELGPVMRLRWLLDYAAAWQMLVGGRSMGDFLAVWRARHAFRRWRKDFAADRREIQRWRKEKGAAELSPFSLLWQYYVRRRRAFSDLPSATPAHSPK